MTLEELHHQWQRESEQRQAKSEDQARQRLAMAEAREQQRSTRRQASREQYRACLAALDATVSSRTVCVLWLMFPVLLFAAFAFGSDVWDGMRTGEMTYGVCRMPPIIPTDCLVTYSRRDEPFQYYVSMAVFCCITFFCAGGVWSIGCTLRRWWIRQ